jgi:Na+/H+ antiporter NhaC
VPILTLVVAVPACIYGFQEGEEWGWKNAFSGSYVPHAMVLAGMIALLAACISFPKGRWKELPVVMRDGAAAMLPALLILWLAWTLGSELKAIGLAERLASVLEGNVSIAWFPCIVFILASLVSFSTGSSWGTMALFMATAFPIAMEILQAGDDAGMYLSYVVGAVFGGAVFGDHCSPFSDTTVVSAMSAGCSMTSHVSTQLPYALIVAVLSLLAYVMMALAIPSAIATLLMAGVLVGGVFTWRKLQ